MRRRDSRVYKGQVEYKVQEGREEPTQSWDGRSGHCVFTGYRGTGQVSPGRLHMYAHTCYTHVAKSIT